MKVPLSWLRDLVQIPKEMTAATVAELFVRVGFEVEAIEVQGRGITGPLVLGRVLTIEELAGHKKTIRYVGLDCGENEVRYVICGAQNFATGELVVVAKPGAILPGNFAISSRETYGKISDGMICSAKELGLGDDHSGIMVIDAENVAPGDDALVLLDIEDEILDIAVNPDRGYALSMRGMARELAGALDLPFNDLIASNVNVAVNVDVKVDDALTGPVPVLIVDGASEIFLRSVENFSVSAKSPLWMRRRIEKCGMRSISLPVDITNYLMLELGQPLHAFDSDRIDGGITVRQARNGESLVTLDKEVRELSGEDLLITDDRMPLALAGTMGGTSAEVGNETVRITIEAAHFHPEAVAKNSRHHRLSTEASRRFERYVDPRLPSFASARAVELLIQYGGAKYLGTTHAGEATPHFSVQIELNQINRILGRDYSHPEMDSMLRRIGADSTQNAGSYEITVPSWRPDLRVTTDFAEELARIHGYDVIPMRLPVARPGSSSGSAIESIHNEARRRRRIVVDFLAARGMSETQNYPFTSQEFIESLGFEGARARAFKLANPLSDEYPVLRTHILQSLLPTAARNFNRGIGDLALFEIGRIFRAPESIQPSALLPTGIRPSDAEIQALLGAVPHQPTMVAGVMAGGIERSGWRGPGREVQWDDAVSIATELVRLLGSEASIGASDFAPWHPGRCAEIKVNEIAVAHAGELHPRVIEALGLPSRAVAFALVLDAVPYGSLVQPKKLATMPPAIQDVALLVDLSVPAESVMNALRKGAGEMLERIDLFDRYEGVVEGKVSLAFTLTLRAGDRTLTSEEIAEIRTRAVGQARADTGAVLRGADSV